MKLFIHCESPRLVAFDMDGTLYPRAIYHSQYYDFTLSAVVELLGRPREDAAHLLAESGITRNSASEQGSVTEFMTCQGVDIRAWNAYRDKRFDVSSLVQPDPKLVDLVVNLKKRAKVTVLTNNTAITAKRILVRLGFGKEAFDRVITSDDGLPVKPSESTYRWLAASYDIELGSVVAVGDRMTVDLTPLLNIGGNGIHVVQKGDIHRACEHLIQLWQRNPSHRKR